MHRFLDVNGLRLAYVDFGGSGPALLLLHGLFGRATTWAQTAAWLTPHFHVVGLDQRGHGLSDKPEKAYSRDEFVDDAIGVMERLDLGPAVIVGHSMGALNAWVLAARRPDLVRGLVLEDQSAATGDPRGGAWVSDWLSKWPVPFLTMAAVREYFHGVRPSFADYFSEVMVETPEGYRPLFETRHMVQAADQINVRDHWQEIDQVGCPALVVKGGESDAPREELQEMARRIPGGRYAEVAGAEHVVHYDKPREWCEAVEPFLLELRRA